MGHEILKYTFRHLLNSSLKDAFLQTMAIKI